MNEKALFRGRFGTYNRLLWLFQNPNSTAFEMSATFGIKPCLVVEWAERLQRDLVLYSSTDGERVTWRVLESVKL